MRHQQLLFLKNGEQAIARGAKIYAEIVSFHTNTDAGHMTNPSTIGMTTVMSEALEKGNIKLKTFLILMLMELELLSATYSRISSNL